MQLDASRYEQLARAVLSSEGINQTSELSVLFVSSAMIAELNEQHMGHTGPTDVLAFPIDEDATQPQAEND
ncbi:MAG: rRNA maturation RNase YbeY, partial [Actinomycetota bacterium]|nr:rRNA maturation RNase YbeY [Actinomycetota bacterium]